MRLLLLSVFCLAFTSIATAQSAFNYQKRFQVKSGHVEYELTGMVTGTKSLWWDYFGEKYHEETNCTQVVKTMNRTEVIKNHSLAIADGTYYYNVDMETMEGTKIHKDAIPNFALLGSGLNDNEMEQLGEGLLKGFDGNAEKHSEVVLGRNCDVTKLAGAKIHQYKGVVLRSYTQINGSENKEEALSFDENISVPASKFTPPANAIISDISAEVSGIETFDEDIEEEQGLLFPTGLTFEKFRNESDRVHRKLGYLFAIHDASGGQYSALWTKDENNIMWVLARSLQNYATWRQDYADDDVEFFTNKGISMAFRIENVYDTETRTSKPTSSLLIELKSIDTFLELSSSPQKSKQQLIEIFNEFNF